MYHYTLKKSASSEVNNLTEKVISINFSVKKNKNTGIRLDERIYNGVQIVYLFILISFNNKICYYLA